MCKVNTDKCDYFVRKAAAEIGDSFATNINFTEFRNRYRTFLTPENPDTARMKDIESSVIAETMMYIEERLATSTLT